MLLVVGLNFASHQFGGVQVIFNIIPNHKIAGKAYFFHNADG